MQGGSLAQGSFWIRGEYNQVSVDEKKGNCAMTRREKLGGLNILVEQIKHYSLHCSSSLQHGPKTKMQSISKATDIS